MSDLAYSLYMGKLPDDIDVPVFRVDAGKYKNTVFSFTDVKANEDTGAIDYGVKFLEVYIDGVLANHVSTDIYNEFGETAGGAILLDVVKQQIERVEKNATSE